MTVSDLLELETLLSDLQLNKNENIDVSAHEAAYDDDETNLVLELDPNLQTTYKEPTKTNLQINEEIRDFFLKPSTTLTWDLLDIFQTKDLNALSINNKINVRENFIDSLLTLPEPISRTSFRFQRKGISGEIAGYEEIVTVNDTSNLSANTSLSLNRKYDASKTSSVVGDTNHLPFQPGGLTTLNVVDYERTLERDADGLFYKAPGLSRGLNILNDDINDKEQITELSTIKKESHDSANSHDLDPNNNANNVRLISRDSLKEKIGLESQDSKISKNNTIQEEIDDILPLDVSIGIPMSLNQPVRLERKQWAHPVDVNHQIENFNELIPNMARTWPFELDTFQKEAVYRLEQGDSVFVAAHTSAGKTVVAEYAIAMANRNMTKCIYTSPIKALSNQKFRDFKSEGQDVGLITGDVQINPDSNCLIMTTEILRSMLYRGADLIRDVEFVIFDEVHYVNDIDRGVVWEEVIIMLPEHVKFILLSATVPNTFEFADWVGRTKHKDIYVISTPKRPVPLEIFIWAKNEMFKVVNSQRKFVESDFKRHTLFLDKVKDEPKQLNYSNGTRGGKGGSAKGMNRGGGKPVATRGGRGGRGGSTGQRFSQQRDGPNKNTWLQLVQYLKRQNLLPAVIFVFSKKRCEEYCDTLTSVDFSTAREKSEIHMFIERSMSILKKEDRELPQILKIRELLRRGIAVHHGGLLPIVKECIEILFSKGLIKVLFATETFAMGLNLPTRTVVFSELRKHDGRGFRNLLPGEFTQMSGRAGRRGLDSTGTVIVMAYNQPLEAGNFKEVTLGTPTKLRSQFRLTYNMILNLLRIEALRVEEMIKRSFSENSTQSLLPEHEREIIRFEKELNTIKIDECDQCHLTDLNLVHKALVDYKTLYSEIVKESLKISSLKSKFKTGRLLMFRDPSNLVRPGFIVRTNLNANSFVVLTFDVGKTAEANNTTDIPYIPMIKGFVKKYFSKMKYPADSELIFQEVGFDRIEFVSLYVLKTKLNDIINNEEEAILDVRNRINTLLKFQLKWDEFDFKYFSNLTLLELNKKKDELLDVIQNSDILNCPNFIHHFNQINHQYHVQSKIASLKSLISDENLELLPDYEQRLSVLKELGFVDQALNVVLKGRVACEINSGWELIMTELVLDNFLGEFEPEEVVALLSAFVYEGKTNDDEDICITPRLERGKEKIKSIAEKTLQVYEANQVPLTQEEEEFLERKRFNLVNVVYEWARGMSFNEIMQMTNEAEGTIVRVINRLDEVVREVKNVALIIGDSVLHQKMSQAQESIKRDIVFCASLYI
ncbi:hypothetical protein PACTADRAFT_3095 [Pachysolen tannophilus NRRL Y-2460]|uniref:Antiviral helicase n=1 Tax=Pachysolen tannophilus NRRL Y-2460 TaxID=669874 RepID=A0A1E4TUI0_PACTA|nr:hypothetical protein PACTADRAFT_3095 [Pachysolen tannophilus NRRL Y-2460]